MLLLASTTDILRVVTGSASTIHCHATWVDNASGTITPGRTNTTPISTATTTTVVASPAASTQRNIKHLTLNNAHATQSCSIIVQHFDGTTSENLWDGTLLAGESVDLTQEGDWNYYNAAGVLVTSYSYPLTTKGDLLTFSTAPARQPVGLLGQYLASAPSDANGIRWATPVPNNASTATVSAGYAADTSLAGSAIAMPSGGPTAGTVYRCIFDMTKTAAGVASPIVNVRFGTAGNATDALILNLGLGAGTAVADSGIFEVLLTFRSVGAGTAAVVTGILTCRHQLASTGLTSTGAAGHGQTNGTSAGFNSTLAGAILSLSFNGGASFSGTNVIVQAMGIGLGI